MSETSFDSYCLLTVLMSGGSLIERSDTASMADRSGRLQSVLTRRRVLALGSGGVLFGSGAWVARPPPVSDAPGWSETASLPTARGEMKGAELDGHLYVPGGLRRVARSTDQLTVYDPNAEEWTVGSSLPVGLNHHATAALEGTLYVVGGNESLTDDPERHAYAYDPDADTWEERPPLPDGRWGHEAVAFDGRLYVVGGVPETDDELDTLVYDPTAEEWNRAAPIPTRREHVAAAVLDGQCFVVGGRWDGKNMAVVEAYDPETDSWASRAELEVARGGFGATVLDSTLHAVGGENPGTVSGWTTAAHERYDVDTDRWERLPDAPLSVHGTVVASAANRLYVVGGAWRQGLWSATAWTDRVFVYDPTGDV